MAVYSILMFSVAAVFSAFGILIYRGNISLIHDYHQTRVKESDRKAYGKSFAKAMFFAAVTLVISGIAAVLGKTKSVFIVASVVILFIGLIVSFVMICRVQKKYNGGIF